MPSGRLIKNSVELRVLRGETENTNSKTIQNYEQARNLEENTEHRHHHPHRHRYHFRGDFVHGRVIKQKKRVTFVTLFLFGDPLGARTQDPNIKSVVLYLLS